MAMTPNQLAQDKWLKEWHQRQKNKPGYNTSWEPEHGWRARFNQSQQNLFNDPYPDDTPIPSPPPSGPDIPWDYEDKPPPPPPLPPPPRPLGFNTLAPTGVPEGGWGGGAIQYETAPATSQSPATYMAEVPHALPGAVPPPASSILPWWHQGGSGVKPPGNAGMLKSGRPPVAPQAQSAVAPQGAAPAYPGATFAQWQSRPPRVPGQAQPAQAYQSATMGQTGQWSSQAPGQSRWPGNAMNRYKPSAMQEY